MNTPISTWRKHQTLHHFLGKQGTLLLWTKIYVAPTGFEHQTPYLVGLVDFGNEQKQLMEIVDVSEESLIVGQKVEVVIRRSGKPSAEGVIEYGVKAKISGKSLESRI
jgi:uncharacterized OB-fold protein